MTGKETDGRSAMIRRRRRPSSRSSGPLWMATAAICALVLVAIREVMGGKVAESPIATSDAGREPSSKQSVPMPIAPSATPTVAHVNPPVVQKQAVGVAEPQEPVLASRALEVARPQEPVPATKQGATEPVVVPAPAQWTADRMRWLFFAASFLLRTKATPVALSRDGRFSEDDSDLMDSLSKACNLAHKAEQLVVLAQRPKQAAKLADEALQLYNAGALVLGEAPRSIDSPAPVEPEELAKARADEAVRLREQSDLRARTWDSEKVRKLNELIVRLPSSVSKTSLSKVLDLHEAASGLAYHLGNTTSGPSYDAMAKASEACLAAYNRLVSEGKRMTVRDL